MGLTACSSRGASAGASGNVQTAPLSYAETLPRTSDEETIEATVRKQKLWSPGLVMRLEDDRILTGVLVGTLAAGQGYICTGEDRRATT